MSKKILALYYSQSGQLRDIISNIVHDIEGKVEIDYAEIKPQEQFPLPWKVYNFFDAMPECVDLVPSEIQPIRDEVLNKDYDLILFGYQPWFLSPSQPTTSFLKSKYAAVLRGKPVVTVIGSRNMWLNGQERVKEMLLDLEADLVGNIVFTDSNPNLVSVLTVMRWSFKGQKEASRFLPEAGVQRGDMISARRFGQPIYNRVEQDNLDALHRDLLSHGAVPVKSALVVLEKRGIKNFRKFAKYIREMGGPGSPERRKRVLLFKRLLVVGVFILSPISSFTASIQKQLQRKKIKRDIEYFKGISFEPDRI